MEHQYNIDTKKMEQFANDLANNLTSAFAELGEASEEAAKCFPSAIRTITASAVIDEFERLVYKYEKASFITRWYWKRRINRFILAIDGLKPILNEQ